MRIPRALGAFLLAFTIANMPAWQAGPPGFPQALAQAVEVDLQWLKGSQFLDSNGDPLAGGKLYFYDAGTTADRTVYKNAAGDDPHSQPVVLDSAGRLDDSTGSIYIPTGPWKVVLTDADDVTVFSEDNIEGALDETALSVVFAKPKEPVQPISGPVHDVTEADLGTVLNVTTTGGDVTINLISAATAGDGRQIVIRKVTAPNQVIVAATGGQSIDDGATTVLTARFQQTRLVSDGTQWHSLIQDIVPGSVGVSDLNAGVSARLVPTGTIIPYSAEACPAGWLEANGASVSRSTYADLYSLYSNDGDDTAIYGDDGEFGSEFNLPDIRGRFLRGVDGVAGNDPDAAARLDRGDLTTGNAVGTLQDDAAASHAHGAGSFAVGAITNGTEVVRQPNVNDVQSGSGQTAITSFAQSSLSVSASGAVSGTSGLTGGSETRPKNIYVRFCVFASAAMAGAASDLNTILHGPDTPTGSTGSDGDLYVDTLNHAYYVKGAVTAGEWTLQSSLVGPSGATGPTGPAGSDGADGTDPGLLYTFSGSTADGDPGAGFLRASQSDLSSGPLQLFVADADRSGNNQTGNLLAFDDASNAATRGRLLLTRTSDGRQTVFDVTGDSTDASGYVKLSLSYVSGAVSFSADDAVSLQFAPAGADGAGDVSVAFRTIDAAQGTDPAADISTDTLTLLEGEAIDITGDSGADSITVAAEAASAGNSGVVELADETEVFAGTDTVRAVPVSELKPRESFCFALSDETSDLTDSDNPRVTFRMPYAFELSQVRGSVNSAPTGASVIVDVKEDGATLMAADKIEIEAGDETSQDAATSPALTDTTLDDDAEITFDITQVGSTDAGSGLKVCLIGNRT